MGCMRPISVSANSTADRLADRIIAYASQRAHWSKASAAAGGLENQKRVVLKALWNTVTEPLDHTGNHLIGIIPILDR